MFFFLCFFVAFIRWFLEILGHGEQQDWLCEDSGAQDETNGDWFNQGCFEEDGPKSQTLFFRNIRLRFHARRRHETVDDRSEY